MDIAVTTTADMADTEGMADMAGMGVMVDTVDHTTTRTTIAGTTAMALQFPKTKPHLLPLLNPKPLTEQLHSRKGKSVPLMKAKSSLRTVVKPLKSNLES